MYIETVYCASVISMSKKESGKTDKSIEAKNVQNIHG